MTTDDNAVPRVQDILDRLAESHSEEGSDEAVEDDALDLAGMLAPLPGDSEVADAVDELAAVRDPSWTLEVERRTRLLRKLDDALAHRRQAGGFLLATLREQRRSLGLSVEQAAEEIRASHTEEDSGWLPPTEEDLEGIEAGREELRSIAPPLLARMVDIYQLPRDRAHAAYVRSLVAADTSPYAAAAGASNSIDKLSKSDRDLVQRLVDAFESSTPTEGSNPNHSGHQEA